MGPLQRVVSAGFGLLIAGVMAAAAAAQDFPTRPIRIIMPYPPGGSSDILARLIAAGMPAHLGQNVVVENKPGAAGSIGAAQVANAAPDGYTILFTTGSVTIDPSLKKNMPYNIDTDLVPITMGGAAPLVILLSNAVPATTVQEFVAYGKANPKALFFGTSGPGATNHVVGELFKLHTGIKMDAVPFKGSGELMPALAANEIQVVFDVMVSGLPMASSGRARLLAVTSKARVPDHPTIPAVADSGFPGFEAEVWFGFFAPKGTPRPIVDKLQGTVAKVLAEPTVAERVKQMGLTGGGNTADAFQAQVKRDRIKWQELITRAGLKIEE